MSKSCQLNGRNAAFYAATSPSRPFPYRPASCSVSCGYESLLIASHTSTSYYLMQNASLKLFKLCFNCIDSEAAYLFVLSTGALSGAEQ
ncbi:hypothetical protein GWI33_013130 [Rhynchophorus ferrugineus]|uniref:Uncharacterized protein n=1 Tax=Rhynchophorus ferrugineus TaxID=354439 RepID=A0A834I585_RHYFE|nr:hypothetical protein GWI33_013130 [Rhynchophorus ferrugineus]